MGEGQEEPKIVVDEDWKSKVAAERQAAKAAKQEQQRPAAETTTRREAASQLPDASLAALVTTLAAQALTAMGKAPDPLMGHPVVRPDLAKHYIDTLGILEEKTKGNLTPEEAELLDAILHDLRMRFVTIRAQPEEPQQTTKGS